jgi:small subunit ribosomal protein S29
MLLLQTAAYARESGWVVLYIPRGMFQSRHSDCINKVASEWIESKTEYAYNPSTKLFNQPALAHSILSSLLTTNPSTLSSIKTKTQIGKYKSNTSISEICKSPKSAESVDLLEGVLKTLEESDRPVLVAVDEVQALFSTSGVRTPDFRVLESYDLSTPNLFLDYLTGKKSFVCPP